jgi:hypothetical protein
MTAYVSIPVATATNVVKVPNGALRYKPELPVEEIRALYQKFGIPEAAGQRTQVAKKDAVTQGPPPQAAGARKGGEAAANAGSRAPAGENQAPKFDTQVVWKLLPDKSLEPVRIKTGITDHTFTEVAQELNGKLDSGDELITGIAQGRASSAPRIGGPGAPRGR